MLVYLEGEDEPTVFTFEGENPQPLIIQDEAGNSYQVTPEGTVTQTSTAQQASTQDATLYHISFLQNPDPAMGIKGGFDSPEERSYPGQNYPSQEIQGENYRLAYKALANGRIDHLLAQAKKQGENRVETTFPEDIGFNPDYVFGFVMRVKNAKKSSIFRLRHSRALVKEINAAKRLILKQFSLVIESKYIFRVMNTNSQCRKPSTGRQPLPESTITRPRSPTGK